MSTLNRSSFRLSGLRGVENPGDASTRAAILRRELEEKESELTGINVELKRVDKQLAEIRLMKKDSKQSALASATLALTRRLEQMLGTTETSKVAEHENTHQDALELKKITVSYDQGAYDVSFDSGTNVGDVLRAACEYWQLKPGAHVLQDVHKVLWPLRMKVVDVAKSLSRSREGDGNVVVYLRKADGSSKGLTARSSLDSFNESSIMSISRLKEDLTESSSLDDVPIEEQALQAHEDEAQEEVEGEDFDDHIPEEATNVTREETEKSPPSNDQDEIRLERTSSSIRICRQFEMVIVLAIVITFAMVSLSRIDARRAFFARESVRQAFVPLSLSSNDLNFYELTTQKDVWDWMDQTFFPAYDNLNRTKLNIPSMCQLRSAPDTTCPLPTSLSSRPCYGTYGDSPDTSPHPNPPPSSSVLYESFFYGQGVDAAQWPTVVGDQVPGDYLYYPLSVSGYCVPLSSSSILNELRTSSWWDASTRLIQISFDVYGEASAAAVNTVVLFETQVNGGVSSRIRCTAVYVDDTYESFDVVIFCLLFLLTLSTLLRYGWKRAPLLLTLDLVAWVASVVLMVGRLQVQNAMALARKYSTRNGQNPFGDYAGKSVDLRGVALQTTLNGELTGMIVAWGGFRALSYLETSPSVSVFYRAAKYHRARHAALTIAIGVLGASFALVGFLIFGRNSASLATFDLALAALTVSWGGPAFVGVATWSSLILSAVAFAFFYLVLFWTCFSSHALSYVKVRDEVRDKGFYWLVETDPAARHAARVAELSGVVFGQDAAEARQEFRGAERFQLGKKAI